MEINISEIIKNLELELLQPETRKSLTRLNQLLSDNFLEYASNGEVYSKEDILKRLPSQNYKFELFDFNLRILSDTSILATYKIKRTDLTTNQTTSSLRSSIWKLKNDNWMLIFHQGTTTKDL